MESCTGCGLEVDGGTDGCQAVFDEETAREYADARFAIRRRMVVDTYCLQHPERYCASAISLAAHLTGLCIALEHRGRELELNAAIQRWLNRRPRLEKRALPAHPADVNDRRPASRDRPRRAPDDRWARQTWEAYRPLQELARHWVRAVER